MITRWNENGSFLLGTTLPYKDKWVDIWITEEALFHHVMGDAAFDRAVEESYQKLSGVSNKPINP